MAGRKPRVLIDIGTDPNVKVLGMYKDYHELLNKRLEYSSEVSVQLKDEETFYAKQGKGILSIYLKRLSIYYITFDQST